MLCFYKWEYPSTGFVVLCVSVCAFFHTSRPLLSFWQNYLISVVLSRLHCQVVHHIPSKISRLSLHFLKHLYFLLVQQLRSILLARIFWKPELEALNDKEIFPFFTTYHFSSFHWFHLHSNSVGHNWYTTVAAENLPRDANNTRTLGSLVPNCYTWKLTVGI